jgi:hypothetical protein
LQVLGAVEKVLIGMALIIVVGVEAVLGVIVLLQDFLFFLVLPRLLLWALEVPGDLVELRMLAVLMVLILFLIQ